MIVNNILTFLSALLWRENVRMLFIRELKILAIAKNFNSWFSNFCSFYHSTIYGRGDFSLVGEDLRVVDFAGFWWYF